jgi:hypothetical protein
MSQTFRCDTNALIAYLYDEIEPVERDVVAAHLERCEACALDLETLGLTRTRIAAWTPPEAAEGFRVNATAATLNGAAIRPGLRLVANASTPASSVPREEPAVWWRRPLPAWGQAVAASMIFAAGLALGAARGTQPQPGVQAELKGGTTAAASTQGTAQVSPDDLARLERTLRGEIAGVRDTVAQRVAVPAAAAPDMRKVEALIAASEEKQQRELAMRTVQMVRDFDLQRQGDLVRFQQALGQFQGTTNAEVRQHRDAIEDLARRVSQTGR